MALTTSETSTGAGGKEFEAEYLSRQLQRVTRRSAYLVHFTFFVEIPPEGERSVPQGRRDAGGRIPEAGRITQNRVIYRSCA